MGDFGEHVPNFDLCWRLSAGVQTLTCWAFDWLQSKNKEIGRKNDFVTMGRAVESTHPNPTATPIFENLRERSYSGEEPNTGIIGVRFMFVRVRFMFIRVRSGSC